MKRFGIRTILHDPALLRRLMVDTIVATEAREGIVVTREQAEVAYDKIRDERTESGSCPGPEPS